MSKLSIFNILSGFSKKEMKSFRKFIISPYFNNQSTLVRLFDTIKDYHPKFESPELEKREIFKRVTAQKNYNDTLLRKYVSGLFKLAEEFLIINGNNKNTTGKSLMLLEEYYKRKLNKFYVKTLKKTETEWSNITEFSEKLYLDKHMLEEIKINYDIMNERQPFNVNLLYDTQNFLFNYFINLTVINYIELKNYFSPEQLSKNKDVIVTFLRNFNYTTFIDELKDLPEEKLLTIRLNYYNLMIIQKPLETRYYSEMKKLIRRNIKLMTSNTLYLYLSKLNNYCVQRVNGGNNSFLSEIFDNYDFALHEEKYTNKLKQNLSFSEFRNTIYFSLELNKLKWTEWYVENFLKYVGEQKRQNLKDYANALIHFEKHEFEESLSSLSKVEHNLPIIRFDADLLLTKLYYKLEYHEACYSLIDSFTNLIQKTKLLSNINKTQYLKYLKFYKLLLDTKSKTKIHIAELIVKELKNDTTVKSYRWLIEESNLLMKGEK